ncbi:RILP-like protein 1 isoform X2 [Engraulis encrasicolus]
MDNCGKALEKNPADLTIMDVYDIAAVMGQEFERIIDQYGCESLTRIMPKVVRVLEILEVLVGRNNMSAETEELRMELERLRLERRDRLEREKRHQKELELVEDVWRGESQELLSQIAELQAQNKSLSSSLALRDNPEEQDRIQQDALSEREQQALCQLRQVVEQQRSQIQAREHELTLKSEDLEALQLQQHRLMRMNQELRHRVGLVEQQGKAVIQQRAQLEAVAQTQQLELGELRQELTRLRHDQQQQLELQLEVEATALMSTPRATPRTRGRRNKAQQQKQQGKADPAKKPQSSSPEAASGACSVETSLWVECGMDQDFLSRCCGPEESPAPASVSISAPESADSPASPVCRLPLSNVEDEALSDLLLEALKEEEDAGDDEEEEEEEDRGSEGEGRWSAEWKESSQPRFTLDDLQEVLQERNELKGQLFMLQEELAYYKSEEQEEALAAMSPLPLPSPCLPPAEQQESGIKRLIFTAVMPMVAAGLISDDPTLLPIRRLISFV